MILFAAAVAWLVCAGGFVLGAPPWLFAPVAVGAAALLPAWGRFGRPRLVATGVVVALFACLNWEIHRNRAKLRASRACCRPLGGARHGRQEELT